MKPSAQAVRVCLVYDCLYPHTVGGAERWYRNLAEELAGADQEVTYLTRRQWAADEEPGLEGVDVFAVSPGGPLYTRGGRRRIRPPVRFGIGVFLHLVRRRHSYDVVHTCAFPFFSVLAARAALARSNTPVAVDWFEVWTRDYWRSYLGRVRGRVGYAIQRTCVRLTDQAFVFSDLHERRLTEEGLQQPAVRLAGLYAGPLEPTGGGPDEEGPLAVFAGRHIPEKRAHLVPAAIAAARERVPGLRGLILGDGPERPAILAEIDRLGLHDVVEAPGFVSSQDVADALARATCMVFPSAREGYGLIVIEAAASRTPIVLVPGPDNAATELLVEGVNGYLAESADPQAIADAIVRVHEEGAELRQRTGDWFAANARRLAAGVSAWRVAAGYSRALR